MMIVFAYVRRHYLGEERAGLDSTLSRDLSGSLSVLIVYAHSLPTPPSATLLNLRPYKLSKIPRAVLLRF